VTVIRGAELPALFTLRQATPDAGELVADPERVIETLLTHRAAGTLSNAQATVSRSGTREHDESDTREHRAASRA
jgi:hypothetical protein